MVSSLVPSGLDFKGSIKKNYGKLLCGFSYMNKKQRLFCFSAVIQILTTFVLFSPVPFLSHTSSVFTAFTLPLSHYDCHEMSKEILELKLHVSVYNQQNLI